MPTVYNKVVIDEVTKIDLSQDTVTSVIGNNFYLWRQSGKYYAKINNGTTTTLNVRSTQFDQPLIIGAGLQTNGTYFRYATCVIDYVRIEYL